MWEGRQEKKKKISRSHGAHDVCSSTAPVFNFRTWKTFPSKETGEGWKKIKQPFSVCHEERDLCRSFSLLHLTTVLHRCYPLPPRPPPAPPPSSSRLLCNMRLLCVWCVDFFGGSLRFAVAAQRTACKLFVLTLTAVAVTHTWIPPTHRPCHPPSDLLHLLALFLETPRPCSRDAQFFREWRTCS